MPPSEKLYYIDKGGASFVGYSINVAGLFMQDKDRNCYLLITIDLFSKWKKAYNIPSLNSWRVSKFLYFDIIAHWGKPRYIWMDNGTKFARSFVHPYKGLGIIHHHITISNGKANGQVE